MADDMGIPQEVVVLLCVIVSAFLVAAGYSVHRMLAPELFREGNSTQPDERQHAYMVEVRRKNWV